MANAFKSFVGGLAGGYINETRRREDLDRQDRVDTMREEEFGLRKRQLTGQLDDQDKERATVKAILEADQDIPEVPAAPASVADAGMAAPVDSAAPADPAAVDAPGVKKALASPGGLASATSYGASANSEEARVQRKADVIRKLRGSEASQAFLATHATNQQALNTARVQAVQRVGLDKIAGGDFAGFADVYNHYNDGNTAVFEPGQGGTGSYAIYKGDAKDGNRIDTISFKDKDDLSRLFIDRMDPAGAVSRRAAAAIKNSELTPVARGAAMVDRFGKEVYRNPDDGHMVNMGTEEAPNWVSTGGKAGKAGKAKESPIEVSRGLVADALEKSDVKAKDPAAYARVMANLDGIYGSNANIAPATASAIATDAEANPANVSFQISDVDGSVNSVYRNKAYDGGKPFVLARNSATLSDLEGTLGKAAVQKEAAKLLGSMSESARSAHLSAARDPVKLKEMQAYIQKNSTPETLAANLSALDNKLQLISGYGMEAAPAAAAAPGAAKPAAVKDPGGVSPAGYNWAMAGRVKHLEDKQKAGVMPLTQNEAIELKQRTAARDEQAKRKTGWFGEDMGE